VEAVGSGSVAAVNATGFEARPLSGRNWVLGYGDEPNFGLVAVASVENDCMSLFDLVFGLFRVPLLRQRRTLREKQERSPSIRGQRGNDLGGSTHFRAGGLYRKKVPIGERTA
jgi:hypothetical protein